MRTASGSRASASTSVISQTDRPARPSMSFTFQHLNSTCFMRPWCRGSSPGELCRPGRRRSASSVEVPWHLLRGNGLPPHRRPLVAGRSSRRTSRTGKVPGVDLRVPGCNAKLSSCRRVDDPMLVAAWALSKFVACHSRESTVPALPAWRRFAWQPPCRGLVCPSAPCGSEQRSRHPVHRIGRCAGDFRRPVPALHWRARRPPGGTRPSQAMSQSSQPQLRHCQCH